MSKGVAIALATLVLAGAYSAISLLNRTACRNTPIQTVVSPDGALKAVLFTRDCGATTGLSSQVSIIGGTDDLPDEPGNTFVADLPQGETAAPWGGPHVEVAWRAPKSLALHYERTARIFKQLETIAGVSVSYPR